MNRRVNDAALVELAVAGDREAPAELLVEHSGPLTRRLASRLQLNPFIDFSIEDVLQEVFLDVNQGIRTFRIAAGTPFSAWRNRVADNRLSAMLRERSRIKRGGGRRRVELANKSIQSSIALLAQHLADSQSHTASEHAERKEVIRAVQEGLAALPDEQQTAIEQRYLAEHSLDSTADAVCKTGGAVRGLLRRAKHAMRDALGQSSRWFYRK